jgi:hypothetical protein
MYEETEREIMPLQHRISKELDAFTYPKSKYYQTNSTNRSILLKENVSETVKMNKRPKHDPSAKFFYGVASLGENTKERGRDPSVIQISDDGSNEDSDNPNLLYFVPDEPGSSRSAPFSFSNNSRPDPPASSIRHHHNKMTLHRTVGRQSMEDPAMSSSISQASNTVSQHAFKAPTKKNTRHGGLFAWYYRMRVAV